MLIWHNPQERNLKSILGAINTFLDSEERKREDNIIKDARNLFRLKKEVNNNIIKDIRILFRLKKENEAINN